MRASYTRLFADATGVSHFEDLDVELLPGFAAPPAEPLHVAEFLSTAQCSWLGGTPAWKGDVPHSVPRRLLFVYLTGESEITAGDGTARRFGPASVLLAEDTWGTGHTTRIIAEGVCLIFTLSGPAD